MIAAFHFESRYKMLFSDLFIAFCILLSFCIFRGDADLVLLYSWFFIVGYLTVTSRYIALSHLVIATIVATVWVHYARDYYGYKFVYHKIFGMNVLPLMAWTLALFGLSEVYNYLSLVKKRYRFLLFIPLFWFLLILFETVAYHILEIRNTMTGSFAGLPYCNCIHAPTWMKYVYFSMGPVYYGATMLADRYLGNLYQKTPPK